MANGLKIVRKDYGSSNESTFEKIALAVAQGTTKMLSAEHQRMLEVTKEAYHIICETPNKTTALKKLNELHPDYNSFTCLQYINYSIRIWNPHHKLDRDFLDTIFINELLKEITNPNADEDAKAKNLATMQRYIASMPTEPMDPMMMEKHQIFIKLNINGSTINVPAEKWSKIKDVKVIADAMVGQEITDVEAEEIMES